MPIYRYACNECGYEGDYLVSRMGESPDECKECASTNITRVFNGQTFATVNSTGHMGLETNVGELEKGIKSPESLPAPSSSKLEAGIHITQGLTRDGKMALNVSRVQDNGKVDASVTGYKTVH